MTPAEVAQIARVGAALRSALVFCQGSGIRIERTGEDLIRFEEGRPVACCALGAMLIAEEPKLTTCDPSTNRAIELAGGHPGEALALAHGFEGWGIERMDAWMLEEGYARAFYDLGKRLAEEFVEKKSAAVSSWVRLIDPHHPLWARYGVTFTDESLNQAVENFSREFAVTEEGSEDEALGWIIGVERRERGIFGLLRWNLPVRVDTRNLAERDGLSATIILDARDPVTGAHRGMACVGAKLPRELDEGKNLRLRPEPHLTEDHCQGDCGDRESECSCDEQPRGGDR